VVDRGDRELQRRAAVHTAATTITHHRALERAFFIVTAGMERFAMQPARAAREWRDDAVKSMP